MVDGDALAFAADLIKLVPSLAHLVPPARVFDKTTSSPWICRGLYATFDEEGASRLVSNGNEADVWAWAAVLGAIDLGSRVILLTDAIAVVQMKHTRRHCSSSATDFLCSSS
jgi:nicotinamidase-related amidase